MQYHAILQYMFLYRDQFVQLQDQNPFFLEMGEPQNHLHLQYSSIKSKTLVLLNTVKKYLILNCDVYHTIRQETNYRLQQKNHALLE